MSVNRMDVVGSGSVDIGSGDEPAESITSSVRKGRKNYHRHNSHQIQQLEVFFKECPHPDENQRRQLSKDLQLEPKQIKFWFQNKRTQIKAQSERADNSTLRAENERIYSENLAIKEALKNVICQSCGVPPRGDDERRRTLQKLQMENRQLKNEHEKLSTLVVRYIGRPISEIMSMMPTRGSSLDSLSATFTNNDVGNSSLDLDVALVSSLNPDPASHLLQVIRDPAPDDRLLPEMEKALMVEAAANALDELTKLLSLDEPFWTKSSTNGRLVLNDSYRMIFPRSNHFKSSNAQTESSKDSALISMNSLGLVDTFLDPDKWANMFPTIITQARTIQVIEPGILGNRSGSLQLMYEQLHVLSPLVPLREFCFLRFCQQIEEGLWVISDVSYDITSQKARNTVHSRSWRLPSGCMIQDMPDGCCKVTWVEHVEVDYKTQPHRLYRDIVCSGLAYGAETWVTALKRMCERSTYSMGDGAVTRDLGGGEGRRSIMKLAHRMVKSFCSTLSMSGKLDFPQLSEVNNSGVHISVRRSANIGEPRGTIVTAATSLWLPVPPQSLFDFFRDEKMRVQWDVQSNGTPMQEVVRISEGRNLGNSISITQSYNPIKTESMMMLQESCIDYLGSLVVSAPVDELFMNAAVSGEDTSNIPILPSGFIICGDNCGPLDSNIPDREGTRTSEGSVLMVAFQILVPGSSSSQNKLSMDSIAALNTLISSTVQRIKLALNCSNVC